MLFDPDEQRAGIMNGRANAGVLREEFDERQVGLPIAALKDVLKISNGLVSMNEQGEMKFWRHEGSLQLHP